MAKKARESVGGVGWSGSFFLCNLTCILAEKKKIAGREILNMTREREIEKKNKILRKGIGSSGQGEILVLVKEKFHLLGA